MKNIFKNTKNKRNTALFLLFSMLLTLVLNAGTVKASSFSGEEAPKTRDLGYEAPEEIFAGELSDEEFYDLTTRKYSHSASNSIYSKYSSDGIYDNLSVNEKILYNMFYDTCESYLTTDKDFASATTSNGADYNAVTEPVAFSGINVTKARQIAIMFSAENPQFYFLDNGILYSTRYGDSTSGSIQFEAFDIFKTGTERREYTDSYFAAANTIISIAGLYQTDLEKEKSIHDYICRSVTYEANDYDQSPYSALMLRKSVCAGYSEAFALLCNGAGIDTISVTSSAHEWNEVKLDGYWYAVDSTWDDQVTRIIYTYYNKSDSDILSQSDESYVYHTPESYWEEYRPVCYYNYGDAPALPDPEPEPEPEDPEDPEDPEEPEDPEDPEDPEEPDYPIIDEIEPEKGGEVVYRVYNPNTGEHFYTPDNDERSYLISLGWQNEGILCEMPEESDDPIYCLYNSNVTGGEHHYTKSDEEVEMLIRAGWTYEGIKFYSQSVSRKPIYRAYNPNAFSNNHNFTGSLAEQAVLVRAGWRNEGTAFYAL